MGTGELDFHLTWFIEPSWLTTPSDISIESAIFPEYTFVTDEPTDQQNKQELATYATGSCKKQPNPVF